MAQWQGQEPEFVLWSNLHFLSCVCNPHPWFFTRWSAIRRLEPTATVPSRVWHLPTCLWSCALWGRRWRWSFWEKNIQPWLFRSPWSSPNPHGLGYRRRQRAKCKHEISMLMLMGNGFTFLSKRMVLLIHSYVENK